MDKRMRDIRKLIKREGLDVLNITTGKHINITVTDGSVVFSVEHLYHRPVTGQTATYVHT